MKKILYINTVYSYGSTGRIVEDLGHIAKSNGWTNYSAFGRRLRQGKSNLIRVGNELGIMTHGIQTRLFDNHGLGSRVETRKFINQIRAIQPDIIHIHNLHGYYINYRELFTFLNSSDIRVVWTIHDCWPFTGHCVYFSFIDCDKWKTECFNCPQRNSYPASWFADRSKSNYYTKRDSFSKTRNLTLVAVSEWISELLKSSFLGNLPTRVINNGVNTSIFSPKIPYNLKNTLNCEDKFIILGIANDWTPRKGINDFIKLGKLIGEDDQIILIGLSAFRKHNLPRNIIAIQRTEDLNELVDFYNCADVFINPTWEDNFPTTNLESLACGTPVITYKTGGSPEAISESTGFVVDQGDINGLLAAVNKVKSLRKSYYSSACRERALNFYDKNNRYKDYLLLYESLLEERLMVKECK